ncbi:hypothetical protein P692DRAFT_201808048 [Suillus brevipes Sb2]|nr:hypothetical protein P692DRAFT_201808048 [Suillus brevipes Sb2]
MSAAEPLIQDEESLVKSKSKSSKGSSVAHASETDLGLLQEAKWRQELTSLIAAEHKLWHRRCHFERKDVRYSMAIHPRAVLEEAFEIFVLEVRIVTERVVAYASFGAGCTFEAKRRRCILRLLSDDGGNVHQEGNNKDMLNPDVLEMGLNPRNHISEPVRKVEGHTLQYIVHNHKN